MPRETIPIIAATYGKPKHFLDEVKTGHFHPHGISRTRIQ
jgi:hypothetical protein